MNGIKQFGRLTIFVAEPLACTAIIMEIAATQRVNLSKIRMLALIVAAVIVTGPHLARSQNQPSSAVRPWQESRTSREKGTHIQTPTSDTQRAERNLDECPDLFPAALTKMDAD